ncbi:MAG: T9SS type A sorting domain-containing protein [bacterium]
MRKFLQQTTPFVLLFAFTTSGLATDRGAKKAVAPARRSDSQYTVPLKAQSKRAVLQKMAPAAPTATEIIWEDDFENGVNGWTVENGFDRQTYWHRSNRSVVGSTGSYYWCADSVLNGYDNDWFQLLATPEIDLAGTTAPVLTIRHSFAIESPDGASQFLPQLDGWDGVAVRISTDGGNTFVTLAPNGGYPRNSLFGFYRTYGFNAAGWVGKSTGWVDATFNLSAYAGRKVVIRFELGSDPGFATEDDNTLFGWRLDNIKVAEGTNTIFSDDAGDTAPARMVPKLPTPNLYWHQVTTRANSPTHSWWCGDDATGQYPNYISNYLISPKVFIPATGENGGRWFRIFLDFQHFYNLEFASQTKFDFFRIDVSNDGGKTWTNPTGFVFVGNSNNGWIPFEGSYSSPFDVTEMAGDTVQFRWQFASDYNVNNIGFFLDDPVLVGVSGFPNDVTTIDLDVAFPNIAGQPTKTVVEVANIGLADQATVPLWYQVNSNTQTPIPPLFPLASGASTVREFSWTPPAAGDYHLTLFTNLPSDEDRSNDSLSTRDIDAPVQVAPAGLAILGYDDRYNPALLSLVSRNVHFTPKTDIPSITSYELQAVFVAFVNQQNTADQLRVKIGTAATPTTFATILLERVETIPAGDLNFHQFDLSGVAGAKNLTGDFLVQVDYTGSNGNGTVLMDGGTRFGGHNYFLNSQTQAFQASDFGAYVRSRVAYLTTAVEEHTEQNLPQQFHLYDSYPNPIRTGGSNLARATGNPLTQISFDLPKTSHVKIAVYDVTGRLIATLANERYQAGRHEIKWNVTGLPAGIYFYRMETDKFAAVRKMLVF